MRKAFVNFKSNKQNKCRNQVGNVQTNNLNPQAKRNKNSEDGLSCVPTEHVLCTGMENA